MGVDAKQPINGSVTFLLRTAALSYHHKRRVFAVRVDIDEGLSKTCGASFGTSPPLRSVARLPDQQKPQPAQCATPLQQLSRPPATPTVSPGATDVEYETDEGSTMEEETYEQAARNSL